MRLISLLSTFLKKNIEPRSSAKRAEKLIFLELARGISPMNTKNKIGPRTEPCGTPQKIE